MEDNTKIEETKEATKADAKAAKRAARKENAFIDELKAEKKVAVKINAAKDDKGENFVPVCINGYIYQVKKGERVDVPETVAHLLEEAGYI